MQSQINPDSPTKEYTGVWIPADVMESEELSPMEKLLYGEIAGFRECYASNGWLAKRIGRTERTVKRLLAHMIELGFIENLGFNGRVRMIRVSLRCQKCPVRGDKNVTPAVTKMSPIIKKNNNDDISSDKSGQKTEYGNKDVNELFSYWREKVEIEPSNNKMNRNSCATLIRQRGVDGAKHVVDLIARAIKGNDQFAPQVSSFGELYGRYGKLSRLDAWEIKNQAKSPSKRFKTAQKTYLDDDYEPSDEERAKVQAQFKLARERLFGVSHDEGAVISTIKKGQENDQLQSHDDSIVG